MLGTDLKIVLNVWKGGGVVWSFLFYNIDQIWSNSRRILVHLSIHWFYLVTTECCISIIELKLYHLWCQEHTLHERLNITFHVYLRWHEVLELRRHYFLTQLFHLVQLANLDQFWGGRKFKQKVISFLVIATEVMKLVMKPL